MKKVVIGLLFLFGSLFAFEELTVDNFDEKVANKQVIVDFHAIWWGACKVLGKNLTKYDASQTDNVTIYKVDVGQQQALAKRFRAFAVPMLVYLDNGVIKGHERGVLSPKEIEESVKKYFK